MLRWRLLLFLTPLALWGLMFVVHVLRGRRITRAHVTIGLSVLTLLYFLAVVGTGIFWVAAQELPVFDWHYLPGYLLLLLTLAHVAFHWRTILGFLRR